MLERERWDWGVPMGCCTVRLLTTDDSVPVFQMYTVITSTDGVKVALNDAHSFTAEGTAPNKQRPLSWPMPAQCTRLHTRDDAASNQPASPTVLVVSKSQLGDYAGDNCSGMVELTHVLAGANHHQRRARADASC
jgi:hypothetical protein